MSSAFVKEGKYEKLNEIESLLSALSLFLRRENGGQVIREIRSFTAKNAAATFMK